MRGTGFASTAAFFPGCRNWCGASVTTSGATWHGALSPVGATSPPTTPTGRCSRTRMNELIPLALQNTEDAFALYDEIPFDLTKDEFQQYAADKGMRRFGTISSARGRPLRRSTSTTRRCSSRTRSPTRTGKLWQLRPDLPVAAGRAYRLRKPMTSLKRYGGSERDLARRESRGHVA